MNCWNIKKLLDNQQRRLKNHLIVFDTNIIIKKYNERVSKTKEYWRIIKIDNNKTNYYVSNLGRVYNNNKKKMKNIKGDVNKYKQVSIMYNNKEYKFSLHRLVAMYFCKIPKRYLKQGLTFNDLVPNHKNGIKSHNASFNLEWLTQRENTKHAWKTGLCDSIRGENARLATISEKTAIKVCELIMQKKRNKEIIDELKDEGVTDRIIQHMRSGECWKHIVCRYKFPKLTEVKNYTIAEDTIHKICQLLELKKYKNIEIAKMCNVRREYVKDIKMHHRRNDISRFYDF